MKRPAILACGLCCATLLACGPGYTSSESDSGVGTGTDGGLDGGLDGGADGGTDGGTDAGVGPFRTQAMPRLSHGIPVFASSSNGAPANNASDDNPGSAWESSSLPAWLAYDISGIPQNQRQNAMVAWYGPRTQDYVNGPTAGKLPVDYTLEANSAPGGGSPPSSGWTQVASVTGNNRSGREHLVSLGSANWVRMNITKGTDPSNVDIDLDVHSAPGGCSDCWLLMGDSITVISLARYTSDLPWLAATARPGWFPSVIEAALGGTSTATAVSIIDDYLSTFAGRYVVLAYGTNDDPANFHMEDLVLKVIAAGKTPVVPHVPWADDATVLARAPGFNTIIDSLYVKYPQILRGPDLWAFFYGRTDLIPSGQPHPNDAGREALRAQWAGLMSQLDY